MNEEGGSRYVYVSITFSFLYFKIHMNEEIGRYV